MVRKMVVRYGNPSGPHNRIDQPVSAVRQRAMVDPELPGTEDGDAITVRYAPPPNMGWARSYVSVPGGFTVMNMDVVDDDVGDVLECDAAVAGDLDVGAATVNGFVTVEDEFVL